MEKPLFVRKDDIEDVTRVPYMHMEMSQAIILAVVQGLTEFLPVSSSGHLVIARFVFNIPDDHGVAFDAFLHLGTLLAVLIYYWRTWVEIGKSLIKRTSENKEQRILAMKIVVATIPAAIIGYFFEDAVGGIFRNPVWLAVGLFITAVLLYVTDLLAKRSQAKENVTVKDAWYIGLAQVIALVPSISRSGSTIAAARALGVSRTKATEFSFLMSAPIIAGAGLLGLEHLVGGTDTSVAVLLVGLVVSFVAGMLGIYVLLQVAQRTSFTPFVIYLLAVGVAILILT